MCLARIPCRLRFVANSRNTPKQPIKEVLQEAITSLQQLKDKRKLPPIATLFVERAKEVMKLVDPWDKHRTPTRLGELVEGFYCLWQVGNLNSLLGTITNSAMHPSPRKNFLNIVNKVARYREAARLLCRTAKKSPLARKMKILLRYSRPCFHESAHRMDNGISATAVAC
jgi:hypothetical protein